MIRAQMSGSSALRRSICALAAVTAIALPSLRAPSVQSAPLERIWTAGRLHPANMAVPQRDVLLGTWQVTRACVSGCTGTTTMTEVVRPYRNGVDAATGTASMMLYRFAGKKVLVHAAASSSLLTLREPGKLMSGPGVDQAGDTVQSTWRCVAAPATLASGRGSGTDTLRPQSPPSRQIIC